MCFTQNMKKRRTQANQAWLLTLNPTLGSQQEEIRTGWARLGSGWEFSQTKWAWPGWEVRGAWRPVESRSHQRPFEGWVQRRTMVKRLGLQPGLTLLWPLLQSYPWLPIQVSGQGPSWNYCWEAGGRLHPPHPPQQHELHYASLAGTTGTPQATKLPSKSSLLRASASCVYGSFQQSPLSTTDAPGPIDSGNRPSTLGRALTN